MNVIVAGSRNFKDYELLESTLKKQITDPKNTIIINGAAYGADLLSSRYGLKNEVVVKEYPANWDKHGRSAGYIRNNEMLKEGDKLIAFWDGKSKGTKHMIEVSLKKKIPVIVIDTNNRKQISKVNEWVCIRH